MSISNEMRNLLLQPIEEIELRTRSRNALKNQNKVNYVVQALAFSEEDLIRHTPIGADIGVKTTNEIKRALALKGLEMGCLRSFKAQLMGQSRNDLSLIIQSQEVVGALENAVIPDVARIPAPLRWGKASGDEKRPIPAEVIEPEQRRWHIKLLPEELQKGLGRQFMSVANSVIDDPETQEEVRKVLVAAVRKKLGLGDS